MKNIFKNLLLIGVVLLTNLSLAPIVNAAITPESVCKFLNYQHVAIEGGGEAEKPGNEFATKLAVIAEERLGNADNKYTFNCFRQVKYTPPTTETGQTGSEGATPAPKKALVTTYESTCTGGNSPSEIAETRKDPTKSYTICEPVMVYISDTGTDLLYFYIGQVYRYAAGVGGLLAVLILIIAGIMRTTAGDNTNQITQANNLVTKSITGLIVLFLSAIILYTINPNFFII